MGGFAWVTLATNDSYSLGALVLANSLKQAGTVHQLAVLVTPGVTSAMREKLGSVFNVVQEVNILDSKDEANLRLLKRPELGVTFTKLHCWRLTQYEKCVFLDADTLVLQNCDELFEREELSAAPDVGWPDCFNSGVFVYRPSLQTYEQLIAFALEKGSFDGGDQGLLNLYFSDWSYKDISKHLPFIYNLCSTACYSYLPAFKQFGANAKIIHFIGATKPWLQYFNTETRRVQPSGEASHLEIVLQRWWDIFCSLIHPQLSPAMAGLAGAFAQLTLGVPRTQEQEVLESLLRKQAWEVGNIDYLGRDSFDNIWSKITETLNAGAPEPAPAPVPEPEPAPAPAESQSQPTAPPQEEAKSDEPPITSVDKPTDSSIPAETLNLQTTEPTPSVEALKTAEEAPVEPVVLPKEPEPIKQVAEIETKEITEAEPKTAATIVEPEKPKPVEIPEAVPTPVSTEIVAEPSGSTSVPKEVPESVPAISEKSVIQPPPPASKVVEAPKEVSKEAAVVAKDKKTTETSKPSVKTPEPVVETSKTAAEPPKTIIEPIKTPVEATKPSVEIPKTPVEATKPSVEIPKTPVEAPAPKTPVEPPKTPVYAPKTLVEAPISPIEAPKPTVEVPSLPTPASVPSTKVASSKAESKTTSKVVEAPKEVSKPASSAKPASSVKAKTVEGAATAAVEKPKQSSTSEAAASSEAASTPIPPPRKTDKPKKVAAKPKK